MRVISKNRTTHQPGSISNHRCDSLAEVGAAWWLLCSPSPAVRKASHCRLPAPFGYCCRAAEVQVDVHERSQQADHWAEDHHQDADADGQTQHGMIVEPAIGPGDGDVLGVPRQRVRVACLVAVQLHVAHLHSPPAQQHGRMRVARHVGEGMVLAVHGHPLPGPDAGGDPLQEAEHLGCRPSNDQRPVGE
jgi:hypothetical protein